MAKTVYDIIKKQNGERFAKAVRNYDNGIFDIPNIAEIVKYAGRDAEPIMKYLVGLKNITVGAGDVRENPFELLHRAGYRAEYADTLDKQNAIKKYFAAGEELCTFRDDDRYKRYYILNVVRYDVDKIRRADFKSPRREDEYGTSVMSIQVLKQGGFISIKNRYNHTVENPDNTYGSNPDNIIYGLSAAISSYFDVNFSSRTGHLPDGYALVDDRIIKYHHEIENTYFGDGFYVKDGRVHEVNKDYELLMDYFLLDLKARRIRSLVDAPDGFVSAFAREIDGKKLSVQTVKDGHGTRSRIFADDVFVAEVCGGEITKLNLSYVTVLEDGFLCGNRALEEVSFSNVRYVGLDFLTLNKKLARLSMPAVERFDDEALCDNTELEDVEMPNLRSVGCMFMHHNKKLQRFVAPNLDVVGYGAFSGRPDLQARLQAAAQKRQKLISATQNMVQKGAVVVPVKDR